MTVYDSLETRCLPLIEHYHADLTKHDREWLAENPGVPFLHFTRECGTHMLPLYPADSECFPAKGRTVPYLFGTADREHILADNCRCLPTYTGDNCRLMLYFDGQTLRTIDIPHATRIVNQYTTAVRSDWKRSPVPA